MSIIKLLLLLKPFYTYPFLQPESISRIRNPQFLRQIEDRCAVQSDAYKFFPGMLHKRPVDWRPTSRSGLLQPIHDVDMVITVGGIGTLSQASHLFSSCSWSQFCDPTQSQEVLDDILFGWTVPSRVSRISLKLNSKPLPTYAPNDVLIAHPFPAAVSRFSFKIKSSSGQPCSLMMNCRCSGLSVCTAIGFHSCNALSR